jgi:hypothetical protein
VRVREDEIADAIRLYYTTTHNLVEGAAPQIAHGSVCTDILRLARVIADAHIQLVRVRQASRDLFAETLGQGDISSELLKQIASLADYERRALSRRNRAIQDLDCQRIMESVTQ